MKQVQVNVNGPIYDSVGAIAKAITDIKAAVKSGGALEAVGIATALVKDLTPIVADGEVADIAKDTDLGDDLMAVAAQASALIAAIKS